MENQELKVGQRIEVVRITNCVSFMINDIRQSTDRAANIVTDKLCSVTTDSGALLNTGVGPFGWWPYEPKRIGAFIIKSLKNK